MQVDAEFVRRTQDLHTPAMVVSREAVERSYSRLSAAFPGWPIHYAIKSNPHPAFVDTLATLGAGFEVASKAETEQLVRAKVPASRIISLHPIKSPQYLEYLYGLGVDVLAADCIEEVEKIGRYAPGSRVVLRLRVDKKGSSTGHHGKFGMEPSAATSVFRAIHRAGLVPWGVTMHPGSQCADLPTWERALTALRRFWDGAHASGVPLQGIIVGGGLPISYRKSAVSLASVAKAVKRTLKMLAVPPTHTWLEPGRFLSADAAILISSIVGVVRRRERKWLFLDAGVFNGVPEALEFADRKFFRVVPSPQRRGKTQSHFVAGPSCHGMDTPFEGIPLPEMKLGERLYVLDVGAYNSTTWSRFNGFELPEIVVYEDARGKAKKSAEKKKTARV